MSTKEKQSLALYFLLAFGLAWLCQVGGCMALLQKQNAVLYQLALVATMLCPLLAVLLDRIEEIGKGEEDAYRNY